MPTLSELREQCRKRGLLAEETATPDILLSRIAAYDSAMRPSDLPPPGDARREHLSRVKDDLDKRIDAAPERYRIDPAAIAPDREILHRSIDQQMVHVTNRQPGYVYSWVYYGQNSHMVWAKRALGWHVVSGSDPECREHVEADGTRKIGDTLLMRIPESRYAELKAREDRARTAQQSGIGSRLYELGERARSYGLKVHTDLANVKVGPHSLMDVVSKRSAAHQTALGHVDKMLRDGTVPTMPAPTSA